MKRDSLFRWELGGGARRLLSPAILFLCVWMVGSGLTPATASELPKTEEDFVKAVRTAIETGDFPSFERMVWWGDISAYKRRVVSAQIRHSLSRPVQKLEIETADIQTRRDLQNIQNLRLTLPVKDLLRVTYADGEGLKEAPVTVFLVGKLEGSYRISLLVRNGKRDPD